MSEVHGVFTFHLWEVLKDNSTRLYVFGNLLDREFSMRLCLVISEAISIKSQQYDWTNVKWTKMILMSITKNYRQLRKTGNGKISLPLRRAHQLVVQCQMVSTENVHLLKIYGPNKSYLGIYVHTYTHMHLAIISKKKKRPWSWRRVARGIWQGLEGGKGREEWYN